MAMIITTNAYLNVSTMEESRISVQKPLFLHACSHTRRFVHLNSKKSRTKVIFCLNLNTKEPSSDDGVLGKDFEFKPSFDQYLKMMESVKTERGRKKFDRLLKDKIDDGDGGDSKSVDSGENNVTASRRIELDRNVKEVKLDKGSEFSVAVQKDDSFRRRKVVVIDKHFSGRSCNKEESGFAFRRVAKERNDVGSSNRRVAKRDDDDDSVGDLDLPAFKFSIDSGEVVDKPPVSKMEMDDRIEKLAKGLNGADINMPEWLFSKAIRSAKIKYSDHTIMRLIQVLGKLGNWRRVLQVIEWLQRQERFKSNKLRIIYTTALGVLGKSRRPVEALNVFRAMQQQMSSYPDAVAYRSIAVTLGQAGHIKELFDVIDSMRSPPKKKFKTVLGKWDPRLEPDVVVYNAVLNACVQRKQWEGAFWVLQQLKQQGQKPSVVTYGLVMEVMFACGKYNLVHEFFKKMQKSSIPNALTYRVLVNTLWKEGKIDEASQAVEEMEQRGIVGSAALYYDLARCLCSAGRCNEGLKLMKKICRVANKPLVVTYTGLIQACIDSGEIENATYIFNEMKQVCSPNLISCNVMVKAYLQHGMFDEAKELYKKMSEEGQHIENRSDYKSRVLPDTYTFNTMLDACARERKWDDFVYVYIQMLRHGYHFNAKRHLRMVLEASRAGKEEVIEATWEHLRRMDRIPPMPLIKERFVKKLEKGDHVSAISSIVDLEDNVNEIDLRSFSKLGWLKLLKENELRFQKDSILQLMNDVNKLVVRRNESSFSVLVLENLMSSCKEFLRNIS